MMEFHDVETSDLMELWESYLIEPGHDMMLSTKEDEWNSVSNLRDKSPLGVVLRDRLMTDAALGGPKPIKSEHSYSLLACSPPPSPVTPGANPNMSASNLSTGAVTVTSSSVNSVEEHHKMLGFIRNRIDDMEEECFPVVSMNSTSRNSSCSLPRLPLKTEIDIDECPEIKGEPISAPSSPCEPSPSCTLVNDSKNTVISIEPHNLHFSKSQVSQTSESEEEDEDAYQNMDLEEFDIPYVENSDIIHDARQGLPPTPPSSASSDSEGTVSTSCSPERRDSQIPSHVQNLKGLLTPRLYVTAGPHTHTTRQPIHTPLISCQPKGSTGALILTEEEKRTLIAEGYPIPTKLPLTKQEEKSLKKIRRKIKNKISAQESRRKKKEYMDNLERRVTILTNENSSYKDRLSILEDTNRELLKELRRLQTLLQKSS